MGVCPGGGIGRHVCLRSICHSVCRFKSCPGHQVHDGLFWCLSKMFFISPSAHAPLQARWTPEQVCLVNNRGQLFIFLLAEAAEEIYVLLDTHSFADAGDAAGGVVGRLMY